LIFPKIGLFHQIKGVIMFSVSDNAIKQFTKNLKEMKVSKEESFILSRSPEDPKKLKLSMGKINTTDHAIKNASKRTVLIVEAALIPKLTNVGLDYDGKSFRITDPAKK
jgi:hypothetical protein